MQINHFIPESLGMAHLLRLRLVGLSRISRRFTAISLQMMSAIAMATITSTSHSQPLTNASCSSIDSTLIGHLVLLFVAIVFMLNILALYVFTFFIVPFRASLISKSV